MALKFQVLLLIIIIMINQESKSQSKIEGQLIIDTNIWRPVAYLSIIPDFDKMNTMSYEMIIDEAKIDFTGKFTFNTHYLPAEDNLYRIHIARKSDPPASLIIGGSDENHIFIIANRNSQIFITDTGNSEFIKDASISGYYPNLLLKQVDALTNYLDTTSFNGSIIKTELIKSAIFERLRIYADSCSNPIVALYALYKSDYEKNFSVNQQFYRNFLSKWEQDKSSYFVAFRKKIPLSGNVGSVLWILISVLAFIVGFLICLALLKFFRKNKNLLHDLSVQERKIYALILEGKSNKEISETLSIGLSTVKSHVNSIYSKLDINSRKDILNLNLDRLEKLT